MELLEEAAGGGSWPGMVAWDTYRRLCGGDPTCVMILLGFAGQGRPFPGEAKGSPESGERLARPRWRRHGGLCTPSPAGRHGPSAPRGTVAAAATRERSRHTSSLPQPRGRCYQGPSRGRTSQLHPPHPEKGGRSWGNPLSVPSRHTAQRGLQQSSDSKSLPTHLDSTNHRIPADRGTSRDSTTTATTADPGHGPRGCPETNTQPGVGATAWTTRQRWARPWRWVGARRRVCIGVWTRVTRLCCPGCCRDRQRGMVFPCLHVC